MVQYERVRAEINLNNIHDNMVNLKKLVNPESKAMAIIKADGYGHGATHICDCLDDIADAYGVAMIDEALQLREHGCTKMILILGYTPDSLLHLIPQYNISQTIYDYETAKSLSDVACKMNKSVNIHIKLDTGMGRLGFRCDQDGIDEIVKISKLPGIVLEGCFTHFSKADEQNLDYTRMQFERYMYMINELGKLGLTFNIRHVCNSAAAMQFPEASLDMVRYGIAIYGLYPSEEVDKQIVELKPAMSIKTTISYVKEVPADTYISYGGTYATGDTSVIATIPVGYADGYPRARSNIGKVIIHGKYAPIVGRICMDQMMVDVTHIPDVAKGDEVILVGTDGICNISVEEVANDAASFNYEFVCNVGKRVPRKYV